MTVIDEDSRPDVTVPKSSLLVVSVLFWLLASESYGGVHTALTHFFAESLLHRASALSCCCSLALLTYLSAQYRFSRPALRRLHAVHTCWCSRMAVSCGRGARMTTGRWETAPQRPVSCRRQSRPGVHPVWWTVCEWWIGTSQPLGRDGDVGERAVELIGRQGGIRCHSRPTEGAKREAELSCDVREAGTIFDTGWLRLRNASLVAVHLPLIR